MRLLHMLLWVLSGCAQFKVQIQMNRRFLVPFISVAVYFIIYLLVKLLTPAQQDPLRRLIDQTATTLDKLVQMPTLQYIPVDNYIYRPTITAHGNIQPPAFAQKYVFHHIAPPMVWKRQNFETQQDWPKTPNQPQLYFRMTDNVPASLTPPGTGLAIQQLCDSGKSKQTLCRVMMGVETLLKLNELNVTVLHSKIAVVSLQQWNSIFLLYSLTAQGIKKILSHNMTLTSQSAADLQLGGYLTQLGHSLDKTDFSHFLKYLRQIEDKPKFIQTSRLLTSPLLAYTNLLSTSTLSDRLDAIHLALSLSLELQSTTDSQQQLAKLLRLWHLLSHEASLFYSELDGLWEAEHVKSQIDLVQFYYFLMGAGIVMVYLLCQVDTKRKVHNKFRHSFPPAAFKTE